MDRLSMPVIFVGEFETVMPAQDEVFISGYANTGKKVSIAFIN